MLRVVTQRPKTVVSAGGLLVLALLLFQGTGCGGSVRGGAGETGQRSVDAAVGDTKLTDAARGETGALRDDASGVDAPAAAREAASPGTGSSDAGSMGGDAGGREAASSAKPSGLVVSPQSVTLLSGASVTWW